MATCSSRGESTRGGILTTATGAFTRASWAFSTSGVDEGDGEGGGEMMFETKKERSPL